MTRLHPLFAVIFIFGLLVMPGKPVQAQDEATIELHWRDCATAPENGMSWYDHCHDGPWRASASEGTRATFTHEDSGENYTGILDGNGDTSLTVPAGSYTFQHPPFHDADASEYACSYVDESGEPVEQLEDPNLITLQSGDHVICDFYIVWGGGRAGVEPLEPGDPQGVIEIRWRACESAAAEEDWYDRCFAPDSELGLEPQEGRRISVRGVDAGPPYGGMLDASGNVQIVVEPGNYVISTMTGDFVTADYLYCSVVDERGKATQPDIATDPLELQDGMHVICDYYYVAE